MAEKPAKIEPDAPPADDGGTITGPTHIVGRDEGGDLLPPPEPDRVPPLHLPSSSPPPGKEGAGSEGDESLSHLGRYRIAARLGIGNFGVVYKAHDDELARDVAIKVPHRRRNSSPEDISAYLAEARVLASLNHPGIVPVYDAGRTEDGLCYVVSKFIEGNDLRTRIKQGRPSYAESVEIVARVAEALHHAHQCGLVHRDVKPANILLDVEGRPYLTDFGLALRDEEFGHGPEWVGTIPYMSPEQARFEGHRVDARSDIYSLGVVFFELLTGQRPFAGLSEEMVLDLIKTQEPRPPRQLNDTIPRELDRICVKSLSKRAADRYSTAIDLADDLKHWQAGYKSQINVEIPRVDVPALISGLPPLLAEGSGGGPSPVKGGQAGPSLAPARQENEGERSQFTSDMYRTLVRIVPKGLRSFDAGDADFFLELLPGPRDRDGLPDSIRFWKRRIEAKDAEDSFRVGLLYGPSGCGKSSLVKAGLLPRLAGNVLAVYVEATARETETRLLKGLRKQCPNLPGNLGLLETLTCLRKGRGVPGEHKVLLVLDQFEQWLHANGGHPGAELVRALRQCDGEHLQGLVMVRDDFWMATTSFMRELEIPLLDGQNSSAVELFEPRHARKVLAAYGRAFGALPEGELSREQEDFLTQAMEELTQDGKVIPVRLSLFAEMIKGRPWTASILREVGGTEGIGVAFLEETFGASTAPPAHRLHQKAARAVLQSLLPEPGVSLRGQMKSRRELLESSGYSLKPKEFDQLLHILDTELRLVTPTEVEDRPATRGDAAPTPESPIYHPSAKCYQLTHDYLVPALHEWLTRKQRETVRGRAELRLAERASLWSALPKNRYLPAWWEWAAICLFTRRRDATPSQRKMMRKAAWYHGVRGLVLVLVLAVLGWGGRESYGMLKARTLRDQLLKANTSDVPGILEEIAPYRRWLNPLLRAAHADAATNANARKQLHTSLALLPIDPSQLDYLYQRLLDAEPHEFSVIRDALLPAEHDLVERLWGVAEQPEPRKEGQRLRAACALVAYDSDNSRWDIIAAPVALDLVRVPTVSLETWVEFLRPVRSKLVPPLAALFRDSERRETERSLATDILIDYAADQPDVLTDLLLDANEKQFPALYTKLKAHSQRGIALLEAEVDKDIPPDAKDDVKEKLAKRKANAAVALIRLGQAETTWPLLKHSGNPTVRSYIINRLLPFGADARAVVRRLEVESDTTIQRALVLSLGESGEGELGPAERDALMEKLQDWYRNSPDAGLHGAVQWLLRQWKQDQWLKQIDEEWSKDKLARKERIKYIGRQLVNPEPPAQWYVNSQGQTMVVIPGPVEYLMGSPETEAGFPGEQLHLQRIGRTFAIAAKPVTVEQFLQFDKDHVYLKQFAPRADCPMHMVTWYEAAAYCNWLSQQDDLPEREWVYKPNPAGKYEEGMMLAADYLNLKGYRLPTEAERECACRAKAVTPWYYGQSAELLAKYGWHLDNSDSHSWPVGSLKPNDSGLFDMHGNIWEWCQERYKDYAVAPKGKAIDDNEDDLMIRDMEERVFRGGSHFDKAASVRAAYRFKYRPSYISAYVGLRPARTFPSVHSDSHR